MASQTNPSNKLAFATKIQSNSSQQQCLDVPSELDLGSLISYTSLKDLIPSNKGLTIQSVYEIPITNLLVKKAAWVYLQPMPAVLPSNEQILCFAWDDVQNPVKDCFRFIQRNIINKIASALEKLLGEIHVGSSRLR